jgi:malic enzyme
MSDFGAMTQIQGTAAVCLAGFIGAIERIKKPIDDLRFVFLGAGSSGTGYV